MDRGTYIAPWPEMSISAMALIGADAENLRREFKSPKPKDVLGRLGPTQSYGITTRSYRGHYSRQKKTIHREISSKDKIF